MRARRNRSLVLAALTAAVALGALGLSVWHARESDSTPAATGASAARIDPSSLPEGLSLPHSFAQVTDRLYRSRQPEGDAEFAALAAVGIRTIVSVDGARPDVEMAAKHGLKYVHVPIGYDGIPAEKAAVIAKAVQVLEGPFLFHCHHGKHRGPAACEIAHRFLDGVDAATAEAEMRKAGTAEKYVGLYRDVKGFAGVRPEVLAAIPSELPAAVSPAGLRKAMVGLDHSWDLIKAVKQAGFATPPEHPDVAPAHQAVIVAEELREMLRLDEVTKQPEAFRALLAASEKDAWDLAGVLDEPTPDRAKAAELYGRIEKSCTSCHAAFRDKK